MGCFTVRSFDNGKTFTAPRKMRVKDRDELLTADNVLELEDGSLMMPLYGGRHKKPSSAIVAVSRDGGETWSENYTIAEDPNNRLGFEKPSLGQLPGSRIICVMQATGGEGFIYQSESEDGGKTWTPPHAAGIYGVAPDLLVTPDLIILCGYCDLWPAGVSLMKSYDWGRTWESEMQLFSADGFCLGQSLVTCGDRLLAVHDYRYINQSLKEDKKSGIHGTLFSVKRPETPKGFSASGKGKNRVSLRWNKIKGASYYILYRDNVPDFIPKAAYPEDGGNMIANTIYPVYMDDDVQPGRSYYYRISAVAGHGNFYPGTGNESQLSDVVKVDIR